MQRSVKFLAVLNSSRSLKQKTKAPADWMEEFQQGPLCHRTYEPSRWFNGTDICNDALNSPIKNLRREQRSISILEEINDYVHLSGKRLQCKNGHNSAATMDMGILVLIAAISMVVACTIYVLMAVNGITIDFTTMRHASIERRVRARRRKERQAGIFTDHFV